MSKQNTIKHTDHINIMNGPQAKEIEFRGDVIHRSLPDHTINADGLRGDILLRHHFLEALHPDPKTITTFRNQLIPGAKYEARRKECPMTVMTDSYKSTHFLMYPNASEMRAYGEFRKSFDGMSDPRLVVYGTKYYIENFINQPIHESDVSAARDFLTAHILGPRISTDLYFKKTENNDETKMNYLDLLLKHRKWPVKIQAMPEGSVIRPHVPLYIITAEAEHSRLCTFLETILTMLWYPCCVATLSRHTKTLIEDAYNRSVPKPDPKVNDDPENLRSPLGYKLSLESRLHDFGFRGCTSVEQSVIGGCAHLLNFAGSDTMSAAYYAQYMLNRGVPVAASIPATEHSVMTSFDSEIQAVKNLADQFPGGMISCVWDAYDYDKMLDQGLKLVRKYVTDKGCKLIVRPDSGDPKEQVIKALKAANDAGFERTTNSMGFYEFKNFAVLQGDGINYDTVKTILEAVLQEKYAASNVAFGMGGGLLQKVNRDTMSFATKLSYMRRADDGREITVVKSPLGVESKMSLGGKMMVLHEVDGEKMTGPHFVCTEAEGKKLLASNKYKESMQVIYDGTKTPSKDSEAQIEAFRMETFQNVRDRLTREWQVRYDGDAVHESLRITQAKALEQIRARKLEAEFSSATSIEHLLHMLDKLC